MASTGSCWPTRRQAGRRTHTPAPEPMPEYQTIVLRHRAAEARCWPARSVLERDVLPAYLRQAPLVRAKDQALRAVRLTSLVARAARRAGRCCWPRSKPRPRPARRAGCCRWRSSGRIGRRGRAAGAACAGARAARRPRRPADRRLRAAGLRRRRPDRTGGRRYRTSRQEDPLRADVAHGRDRGAGRPPRCSGCRPSSRTPR